MKSREEYLRTSQAILKGRKVDIDAQATKGNGVSAELRADAAEQVEFLKKIEDLQKYRESTRQDLKAGPDLSWRAISEAGIRQSPVSSKRP